MSKPARSKTALSDKDIDGIILAVLAEPLGSLYDGLAGADPDVQNMLLRRSSTHGASVLLARKLFKCSHLADSIRKQLVGIIIQSTQADEQLATAVVKVTDAFRQARIVGLAYKGPVLWRALGLSCESKSSADIDFIVRPDDAQAAEHVLESLGYHCIERDPNEASYHCKGLPFVDLHTSLLTLGGWGDHLVPLLDHAWEDRGSVTISGVEIPTLGPTDTLLALVLHAGCHHICTDWASLHDIAVCTNRWSDEIDWDYLLCASDMAGARHALHAPLWLATEHFGATLPDEVAHRIRLPLHRRALRTIALRGFHARYSRDGNSQYRALRMAWNLLSQPGLARTADWLTGRAQQRGRD